MIALCQQKYICIFKSKNLTLASHYYSIFFVCIWNYMKKNFLIYLTRTHLHNPHFWQRVDFCFCSYTELPKLNMQYMYYTTRRCITNWEHAEISMYLVCLKNVHQITTLIYILKSQIMVNLNPSFKGRHTTFPDSIHALFWIFPWWWWCIRAKTETINYAVTNDVFLKWPLAIMSKQQRWH